MLSYLHFYLVVNNQRCYLSISFIVNNDHYMMSVTFCQILAIGLIYMRLQSIGLFFIFIYKILISIYVGPYVRCIYLFIDILLGDSLINYDFNSIDVGLFCYTFMM